MRRREFITLLGGAAAVWPFAARAQQPERVRRIGVLMRAARRSGNTSPHRGVRQGLQQLGWTDGRNVRIEYRWAEASRETFANTRRNWSRLQPDVILAYWQRRGRPLQQATRTLPIVFAQSLDPVGAGFVESLARPGGNVTGFMMFEYGLGGKWLELLKQIAPGVTRAAVLRDPAIRRGRSVRRHPGRGAVVRDGGQPDRRARCRRDRARRRGLRAPPNGGLIVPGAVATPSRADHHACGPAPVARGLLRRVCYRAAA